MFLNYLNEEEKLASLSLFAHIIDADNEYQPDEFESFQDLCKELRNFYFDYNYRMSEREIFDFFKNSDPKIKKIILFECISLINADNEVAKAEVELLNRFAENIGESKNTINKLKDLYNNLLVAENNATNFVFTKTGRSK
ncbi:MAG: hypothetical protein KBT47_06845 [Armatimonadetes bacterium]|nr:hypothetical protein [Candidatus Hippobium faecium]